MKIFKQKDKDKVYTGQRLMRPFSIDGKKVDIWVEDPAIGWVIRVDDEFYKIPFDQLFDGFMKEILNTDKEIRIEAKLSTPYESIDRCQSWKLEHQEKLRENRKWKSKHKEKQ